jgi:hypothetical protein
MAQASTVDCGVDHVKALLSEHFPSISFEKEETSKLSSRTFYKQLWCRRPDICVLLRNTKDMTLFHAYNRSQIHRTNADDLIALLSGGNNKERGVRLLNRVWYELGVTALRC